MHKCLSTQLVYVEIVREGVAPKPLHANHATFQVCCLWDEAERRQGPCDCVSRSPQHFSAGHLCGYLTLDFTQRVFAQMKEIM